MITIRTCFDRHPSCPVVSIVTAKGRDFAGCGGSWCMGGCGLPALVGCVDGLQVRLFGSQVAVGPMLQEFRNPWRGATVELPDDLLQYLRGRLWW